MVKRALLSVLGIVLVAVSGAAWSGKVAVTEPSGKTWAEGSKHSIKWTGKRQGGKGHYGGKNVRIALMYNGKFYKTLIASTPNDGRWVWKSIPNVTNNGVEQYQIRVGPVLKRAKKGVASKSTKFKIKE